MISRKELGVRLARAREDAGLEQADVARKLGVHYVTVSRWENGKQPVKPERLRQLAALYRQPVSALTGEMGGAAVASPGTGEVVVEGHAPTVAIAPGPGLAVPSGSATATQRVHEAAVSFGVRPPLPQPAREYLAELRLRFTKGGVTDIEITAAESLLLAAYALYQSDEDAALRGMRSIAEGVIIPEMRARGWPVANVDGDDAPSDDEVPVLKVRPA